MTRSAFLYLLGLNLRQRPGRVAMTVVSFAAAAFFLTAVLSASIGMPGAILSRIEAAFPARRLVVRGGAAELALLRVEATVTDAQTDALRALDGVGAVHPVAALRVPISLRGSILGNEMQTDSFVWGVPAELLGPAISPTARVPFANVAWRRDGRVPAVIPGFFLDMYNSGFAVAGGLPQISPAAAVGRGFELLLGTTTLAENWRNRKMDVAGTIVGVTDDASLIAILLPLETVLEMNAWYTGERDNPGYVAVHIDLADLAAYDAVMDAARAMGLRVTGNREIIASVRFLTLGGASLLAVVGAIVVAICAIGLSHAFALTIIERRPEIGLFCAVGGAGPLLRRLYLAEAAVLSGVGGAVGAVAAWGALRVGESAALAMLPKLTFLPERVLWLSPVLPAMVIAGLVLLGMGACLPPLVAALRRPPAEIVAGANP